ncbi:hypothetical protein AAG570_012194, partial [Ranatra chinensis]
QSEKLPITTHVLDISKGVPAAGLAVSLYQLIDGRWTIVKDGHTNGDGRCNTLTSAGSIRPGRYKLHFDTDRYFVMHHQATFFPFVEVRQLVFSLGCHSCNHGFLFKNMCYLVATNKEHIFPTF